MKTHYRTIWISDLHLGTRGCKSDNLLSFFKNHNCDYLYLVGDIVDAWRLKTSIYWPQSHSDVIRRIFTMAKRGTQVTYIAGNHDEFLRPWMDDYDLSFGNINIVREAEHTTLEGKRFLIVHGDEFDGITKYHKWLAFLGDHAYTLLLSLNHWFNWARARFGFKYWSLSAYIKHKTKEAVNFICEFEESVAWECNRRGFDGVVSGHIHHPEIREIKNIIYANDSDWVESCCFLAEDDDGSLVLIYWGDGTEPKIFAE
jgi:UDP-2,3-diacylglucosamine pyrophosphatase LpxH